MDFLPLSILYDFKFFTTKIQSMKTKVFSLLSGIIAGLVIGSSATAQVTETVKTDTTKYFIVDLYTGDTIDVVYDDVKYVAINKKTGLPLEYYVITNTMDTVHAMTGLVVNNRLLLGEDKKYKLDDAKIKWDGNDLKIKEPGKFIKWEDGRLVMREGDKYYIEQKDGDIKSNDGWTTIKWKGDKLKMEDPTKKTKIKDDKTKTKTKSGGDQ